MPHAYDLTQDLERTFEILLVQPIDELYTSYELLYTGFLLYLFCLILYLDNLCISFFVIIFYRSYLWSSFTFGVSYFNVNFKISFLYFFNLWLIFFILIIACFFSSLLLISFSILIFLIFYIWLEFWIQSKKISWKYKMRKEQPKQKLIIVPNKD